MRYRARPATVLLAAAIAACTGPAPDRGSVATPPAAGTSAPASADPSTFPAATGAGTDARWTEVADAPLARLEMATAAHDGRIWMAGGLSPLGGAVADVEIFEPASGEWSDGPSLPAGIHHAALVSDGERLWLIGGYLGASFANPTDIVLTLADAGGSWEPGPTLPQPRAAGAAAWDGGRIVYAGGVGPGGVSADVYAMEGGAWVRLPSMPRAREHLGAASDGQGRTWLLGGRVGGLDTNLADVDLVEGDEVTALDPLPTARGGVGAFHLPGLGACLTGGEAPTEVFRVTECVTDGGTVTTGPPMNVPRHGHGAAVIEGTAYVLMGGPLPTLSAHESVERLDRAP